MMEQLLAWEVLQVRPARRSLPVGRRLAVRRMVGLGRPSTMSVWIILGIIVLAIALIGVLLQLPPQHRFIDCCGNDDQAKLIKKLEAGADPNKAGLFGLTPLGEAIRSKRLENVRLLLKAGALVRLPGARSTHLHTAVEEKAVDIAEVLIEAGADPNAKNVTGRSPFQLACADLDLDMARMMLQHGANAESLVGADDERKEPLIVVIVAQCAKRSRPDKVKRLTEMVALLLDHGASPNARSAEGAPLAGLALPEMAVLRLLVERGAITDVAWDGIDLKEAIESALEPQPIADEPSRT